MRPALNLSPRVLAPAWPLLLLLGCVCETQLAHRTRAVVRRAWMAAVMLCTGTTIRCFDALVVATSVRVAGRRCVAGEEHHSNSESLVGLKARCSTKILVTSHAARSEHASHNSLFPAHVSRPLTLLAAVSAIEAATRATQHRAHLHLEQAALLVL